MPLAEGEISRSRLVHIETKVIDDKSTTPSLKLNTFEKESNLNINGKPMSKHSCSMRMKVRCHVHMIAICLAHERGRQVLSHYHPFC